MTGSGMAVFIITMVLNFFGVVSPEGDVGRVIDAAITVGSFALMTAGQVRRADLHFGIWRKKV